VTANHRAADPKILDLRTATAPHPSHSDAVLTQGGPWFARLRGVRVNPSSKSHAELNESTTLADGDPFELAKQLRTLRVRHRHFSVLGGCCGSDHRHAEHIGLVCRTL
jgi:homocysteine S-methyltransferase